MSYFLMWGLIAGAIVLVSGLLTRPGRWPIALVCAVLAFFIFGAIGWWMIPTLAWNFRTGWLIFAGIGVAAGITAATTKGDSWDGGEKSLPFGSLLASLVIMTGVGMPFVGGFFTSNSMIGDNAVRYQQLIGHPPVTSEFTADVAPIDLRHVRQVDGPYAANIASRIIEQIPSLGSRVNLGPMHRQTISGCFDSENHEGRPVRIQFRDNELVWVAPLVHDGFFRYASNHTTPGYVIVSAEDARRVFLVTSIAPCDAPSGHATPLALRYFADGWFEQNLERYLREHGYANAGLTNQAFEVDNAGRPYWVVTLFHNAIGFNGQVVDGILVVDAQTGEIKRYGANNAPSWVNLIQPDWIVYNHLYWWGHFIHGWGNSWQGKTDVVLPDNDGSLVDGADGRSYYFFPLGSATGNGAMNSYVLVDTQTGAMRRYMVPGANPDSAAQSATGNNDDGIRAAHYQPGTHTLINLNGAESYFFPMKDDNGLVKAFVFVSYRNYQITGGGTTVDRAIRNYEAALARSGTQLNADSHVTNERIVATVRNSFRDGDTIYLLLNEQPNREFFGSWSNLPELKWAERGDHVTLEVEAGQTATSTQITSFDDGNVNLPAPN